MNDVSFPVVFVRINDPAPAIAGNGAAIPTTNRQREACQRRFLSISLFSPCPKLFDARRRGWW